MGYFRSRNSLPMPFLMIVTPQDYMDPHESGLAGSCTSQEKDGWGNGATVNQKLRESKRLQPRRKPLNPKVLSTSSPKPSPRLSALNPKPLNPTPLGFRVRTDKVLVELQFAGEYSAVGNYILHLGSRETPLSLAVLLNPISHKPHANPRMEP